MADEILCKKKPGYFNSHEMLGCDHTCWYPTHLCEHCLSNLVKWDPFYNSQESPQLHPTLSQSLEVAEWTIFYRVLS